MPMMRKIREIDGKNKATRYESSKAVQLVHKRREGRWDELKRVALTYRHYCVLNR